MKKHAFSYVWRSIVYAALFMLVMVGTSCAITFLQRESSPLGVVFLLGSILVFAGIFLLMKHRKRYADAEELGEAFTDIFDNDPKWAILTFTVAMLAVVGAYCLSFAGNGRLSEKYPVADSYLMQNSNVSETNLTLIHSMPIWATETLFHDTQLLSQLKTFEAKGTVLGLEQVENLNEERFAVQSNCYLRFLLSIFMLLVAGAFLHFARRIYTYNRVYDSLDE